MQNKIARLARLPDIKRIDSVREQIRELNLNDHTKIVVFDDDPTGSQTVFDIPIYLSWDKEILENALERHNNFYLLINSRAFETAKAIKLNQFLSQILYKKANELGVKLKIISRSDSTLRGHFKAEIETLSATTGPYDGMVVMPYFLEGGRYTIDNIHYVAQGGNLVEAHLTEFARDPVFGFSHSNLCNWIEEKSEGKWSSNQVISISIDELRVGGVEPVKQKLLSVNNFTPVVVNAACDEDLEVFILALVKAEATGKRFLYRTAASFVKIRMGLEEKPYYQPSKLGNGLIVVGSHVQKTTEQLHYLLEHSKLENIELKIEEILKDDSREMFNWVVNQLNGKLEKSETVVLSTERKYQLTGDKEQRLTDGKKVSDYLSGIVHAIDHTPDFIISKGGITSCDVAKYGLEMQKARIVAPIIKGVPVWHAGPESKFPGLPYVVFPGNVGGREALFEVFQKLARSAK